jgi:hypothetical protein
MDDNGTVLLVARACIWSRDLIVQLPGGDPTLTIRRGRLFPLTGRALVRELPAGSILGVVRRNGSFRDEQGTLRGRFVDARSLRHRMRESALQAAFDAVLNSDGSIPSGPEAFVLHANGDVAGTLVYGKLPFATEANSGPERTAMNRYLPGFAARAWSSLNAVRGWKFVRNNVAEDDPRLYLAAALFTAELSRW